MRLLAIGVVLLLLSPTPSAQACSCSWAGPFASVAPSADLVVRGKVLSYDKNSLKLQVLEVLRGKESRKTIRVWGDNGAQCSPYVTAFPIGTEWILAIRRTTSGVSPGYFPRDGIPGEWKKSADYRISICGEFWLQVVGQNAVGIVHGKLADGPKERIPLGDVRTILAGAAPKTSAR